MIDIQFGDTQVDQVSNGVPVVSRIKNKFVISRLKLIIRLERSISSVKFKKCSIVKDVKDVRLLRDNDTLRMLRNLQSQKVAQEAKVLHMKLSLQMK